MRTVFHAAGIHRSWSRIWCTLGCGNLARRTTETQVARSTGASRSIVVGSLVGAELSALAAVRPLATAVGTEFQTHVFSSLVLRQEVMLAKGLPAANVAADVCYMAGFLVLLALVVELAELGTDASAVCAVAFNADLEG